MRNNIEYGICSSCREHTALLEAGAVALLVATSHTADRFEKAQGGLLVLKSENVRAQGAETKINKLEEIIDAKRTRIDELEVQVEKYN